jgi:apolipoprotein N-acyltransferase
MKKYQLFLLSILSGVLLGTAWFPHGIIPLLFVSFVPLLIIEQVVFQNPEKHKSRSVFFFSYISFFIWNSITTWWLVNASWGGAVMAIVLNSMFMAFIFLFFHRVKKRVGEKWGNIVFISCWIAFEFLYYGDQITWPWLTLGNAFADNTSLIQWYEYTGVFGGSLWVLVMNCIIFSCCSIVAGKIQFQLNKRKAIILTTCLALPILLSFLLSSTFSISTPEPKQLKIVIIQPNIDPYNEKFIFGNYEEQEQKMLSLAKQKVDSTTDYIILPETAFIDDIWEDEFEQTNSIITLRKYIKQFPKLKVIIGASTAKAFKSWEKLSATARKFNNADAYYDQYNAGLQIDNTNRIQVYHKSKLVPGVEQVPFRFIFKYLDKYALEMGGTTGSLGTQTERTVFKSSDNSITVAPVICYESVYGEFVSQYIQNGAQFISIITNDGWWGDTPGYQQHLKYGRLRAIENRRWIVRSANTGTSCFISPLGEIQQATKWWESAVISGTIELNDEQTFYTRFGDYIGRIAMYTAFILIIYSWLIRFRIIKK